MALGEHDAVTVGPARLFGAHAHFLVIKVDQRFDEGQGTAHMPDTDLADHFGEQLPRFLAQLGELDHLREAGAALIDLEGHIVAGLDIVLHGESLRLRAALVHAEQLGVSRLVCIGIWVGGNIPEHAAIAFTG